MLKSKHKISSYNLNDHNHIISYSGGEFKVRSLPMSDVVPNIRFYETFIEVRFQYIYCIETYISVCFSYTNVLHRNSFFNIMKKYRSFKDIGWISYSSRNKEQQINFFGVIGCKR